MTAALRRLPLLRTLLRGAQQRGLVRHAACPLSCTTDIEKEVANDLKAAFEEQYPNATVEYNFLSWTDLDAKLLVMDQANDYPDVTQINEVENAVRAGALEPIEPYLEKSDILSLENFNQVGLDYKTYDGVLYGLPHVLCTYAHIYNKDLCDEAGIDPTTFETWDDVLAAVETIGSMDGKYGYAWQTAARAASASAIWKW